MTATAAGLPGARRLGFPTRFFYGFGSIAFGVKDNGFSYFLGFFYAQVVGLPAATVGLAIMFAFILDAFIDPIIGQLSDNTRSRWGRRHPFMYLSAVPVGASYLLLWNPPKGWEQGALVAYLVAVAILIRTFISCYEIPSAALASELTTDYDERTRLLSWRYLFGWVGGLAMYGLALFVFLKPDAAHPVGQLNPAGYARYGLFAGGLMIFAILVTSIGTHKEIPKLRAPPHARVSLGQLSREMFGTLANRTFLFILSSSFFYAMGIGLGFSINLYFSTYFWEFSSFQIGLFTPSSLAAAILAFAIAPRIAQRFDKKPAAMVLIPLGLLILVAPVILRLMGMFLPNGSAALYPTIWILNVFGVGLGITGSILFTSMIADVVEDSELKTGRRQEGLFFAAAAFINKAVSGMGIFTSGMIISAIHFPKNVKPGEVPPETLRALGLTYLPVQFVLYGLTVLLLMGYRISRSSHEETLRKLAAAADLVVEGEPASTQAKLS
ncbi:MFS transporter [Phenylobacterium sp.]|uniref:MFS transporter n=1 Tax=Phenylobacterium sp. TaxID=1871053 RepID=UPI002DEE2C63|nr:MFS transporter [Phenylobacterium sp.]